MLTTEVCHQIWQNWLSKEKINNNLLFSAHTKYESYVAKKNHLKDTLENKNTRSSVLKMFFSPGATGATMKSIDRSPTETTAVAAITEGLSDPWGIYSQRMHMNKELDSKTALRHSFWAFWGSWISFGAPKIERRSAEDRDREKAWLVTSQDFSWLYNTRARTAACSVSWVHSSVTA